MVGKRTSARVSEPSVAPKPPEKSPLDKSLSGKSSVRDFTEIVGMPFDADVYNVSEDLPKLDVSRPKTEKYIEKYSNNAESHLKKYLIALGLTDSQAQQTLSRAKESIEHVIKDARKPLLPEHAPKLYVDRPKGQNIIDFLRDPDGWGPYVQKGALTRPALRQLDPDAYFALTSWLQRNDNRLPSGMTLQNRTDLVNAEAARIAGSAGVPVTAFERVSRTLAKRRHRSRAKTS